MIKGDYAPVVLISLLIGVVIGFAASYVVYGPNIKSLDKKVSDLEVGVDTRLNKVEFDLSDLKNSSPEIERDDVKLDIESLEAKLDLLGKENRESLLTIDKNIDEIKGKVETLEVSALNERTVIDVYNNVSPSVVFIISTVLTYDFVLQEEVPAEGVGSGVVVSPEGYILTNNHVVEGAEFITVSFKPGEEIEAELIGTDPPTDLAVIKIPSSPNLPIAKLGDSDKVKVGMTAIAIGNPFSLERTVTVGVVSSVNRTIDAETGDIIFGVIQTDASINPGNSGGPLVNTKGEVIGINSAIISPVRGSVGIGFSIPINTAKKVMQELIEKGRVSRPYLGITGGSVASFPPELELPEKGILIIDVIIDSPADKAGLLGSGEEVQVGSLIYPIGGDVIVSGDGSDLDTIEDLLEFLSRKNIGEKTVLGILREGNMLSVEVVLEERP